MLDGITGAFGAMLTLNFKRNFHDFIILDASAWNWRPPQDPQWAQISALNNWQSFIKSNQGIMQVLAGKDVAQRVRGILQQYDRRVIPAFNEIIKLLQHPVQQEKAEEMRPFLRTDSREVPIFDQHSVSSMDSQGPLLVASRHVPPIP